MPTINQLVHKTKAVVCKVPALKACPQKRCFVHDYPEKTELRFA